MMKKSIILAGVLALILCLGLFPGKAFSEEAAEEAIYKFPEIKTQYSLSGGYRFAGLKGSGRGGKFEYLHNSLIMGGEIIAFPFPHRIHLDVDILNSKEYFGDLSYAYKDAVLSRWIKRAVYHNTDNITLIDLNTSTASPGVTVLDRGEEYGIKMGIDTMFLRFKTPDFPFHFYLEGRTITKKGSVQQIFLGGNAYYTDLNRVSRRRGIDWTAKDVTFGINSHLGPVEFDLSHTDKRFESGADRFLTDSYTAGGLRGAGTYPHNLIPNTQGTTDTLKIHTSYTGRLVLSSTFSYAERLNNDSLAKAEYFTGAGDITWMSLTKLTLFIKYRHRITDLDNPDSLPSPYLGYTVPYLSPIKNSISSRKDTFTSVLRYRASRAVTMHFKYSYERHEREHAEEWKVKAAGEKDTVSITVDARPAKSLNLKAGYEHQELNGPVFNTQPNRAESGNLTATWNPAQVITLFLGYNITKQKRDKLHYIENEANNIEAQNRDAKRDRVTGILTLLLRKDITLTTSYAYFRNRVKQDLIYNMAASSADQLDRDVVYKDTGENYAVNLSYLPSKRLDLNGGFSLTNGRGDFTPNIPAGQWPLSINSFSRIEIRQTEYALSGGYAFRDGWKADLSYKYRKFDDLVENPNNPAELKDGIAQIVLFSVTKRWQ